MTIHYVSHQYPWSMAVRGCDAVMHAAMQQRQGYRYSVFRSALLQLEGILALEARGS